MTTSIIVRLENARYRSYPYGVIGLGTPLEVVLASDTLIAGDYDSAAGWYQRLAQPQAPILAHLHQNRYAFCGRVAEVIVAQDDLDIVYFVLLDCGLPISLPLTDLAAEPGEGNLGRHVPDRGTWLSGVAHLKIDWPDQLDLPVSQAVQGTVIAIERLILRPGPGFGESRREETLPPTGLDPDQIYLTLKLHDELAH